MLIKISVIVPVYNLQDLLPICVGSILSQTFTDFELILVNDGSTDQSGEICDRYAESDSRIIVIHKENGGTSTARNAGLKIAQGDYIAFVDNDDYIHPSMLETLYNQNKKHQADIIMCDFQEVCEDYDINKNNVEQDYSPQHYNNIEALEEIYNENRVIFIVPWNKLYKKYLFEGIEYTPGNMHDDESIIHYLLYRSQKTTYLPTKLYYYLQRSDSLINTSFNINRLDVIDVFKNRAMFFKEIKQNELHQKALKDYMGAFFYYYYTAKEQLNNVEPELKNLKRIYNQNIYDLIKNPIISWKQKTMCALFFINPTLFEWIRDSRKQILKKQEESS